MAKDVITSSGRIEALPSSGVPAMGLSTLTGIESTPILRNASAISILSRMVSPIPIMPPEHTLMPTLLALSSVSIFCSTVCVVHNLRKNDGELSRLQWYRVTPLSYSFCISSRPTSPREAHTFISVASRISEV